MNQTSVLRRRRLWILAAIVALIAAILGGLYAYQQHRLREQAIAQRQAGLNAYDSAEYKKALHKLGQYISSRNDVEPPVLYAYAKARLEVPQARQQHILGALQRLEQLQQQHFGYKDTADTLMDLYLRTGQNESAVSLAERLLRQDQQHEQALRTTALGHRRLSNPDKALSHAKRALKVSPRDLQMHLLVFDIKRQRGKASALVERAEKLREKHPDDARFVFLQAYAYAAAGQAEPFEKWLQRAAAQAEPRPILVRNLLHLLDQVNLYEQSATLMQTVGPELTDLGLRREAARRLLAFDRHEQVVALLRDLNPAEADADITAYKALALYRLGRTQPADKLVQNLAQRRDEPLAASWASVLKAATSDTTNPSRMRQICQQAIDRHPSEAHFHAFLAQAYANMGELTLAIEHWQSAAKRQPAWAEPRRDAAHALLTRNQPERALDQARAAYRRRPRHVPSAAVFARAQAATLAEGATPSTPLLDLTAEILELAPLHPEILPLRIALLTRANQPDAARQAIDKALQHDPTPSEPLLRELASISKRFDLQRAKQCYSAIEGGKGLSPMTALERAIQRARQGEPERGRQLIKRKVDAAPASRRMGWQLAWAQYLDAIDADDEDAAWQKLLADHPQRARLRRMALEAEALQDNRSIKDALIEELRELTGDDSFAWRVARARWLLDGDPADASAGRVISLLKPVIAKTPDHVDARLLLAAAHEQAGHLPLAARQLESALQRRPQALHIRMQLARLHQRMRTYGDAQEQLQHIVDHPRAPIVQRVRAARLLAQQGATATAIDALEAVRQDSDAPRPQVMYRLAQLYTQTNQHQQAKALCNTLAKDPPSPGAVVFLARFFHGQGDTKRAKTLLKQLASFDLNEADRFSFRARFHAGIGQRRQAMALYQKAAQAARGETARAHWRTVVTMHLQAGEAKQAFDTAKRATLDMSQAPALNQFRDLRGTLEPLIDSPTYRQLAVALLQRPAAREAAIEAIRTLAQADLNQPEARTADALAQVAEKHGDVLALRLTAATVAFNAGRTTRGLTQAQQAMRAFPRSAFAARRAAELAARAGRWQDVLAAARAWKQRAAGPTLAADAMRARASLETNNPTQAIDALEAHLAKARQHADQPQQAAVVYLYARAMLADERYSQTKELLSPLLSAKDSQWRQTWMHLATDAVADAAVARRWLEHVARCVPDAKADERLRLSQSWWQWAHRSDQPVFRQRALEHVQALLEAQPKLTAAWLLRGRIAERQEDWPAAERAYRQAIKTGQDAKHLAQNNLAMVLVNQGNALPEAQRLAQQAAQAKPDVGDYHDTLARVHTARGQLEKAIAALRKATALEPNRAAWQKRLAKLLEKTGRGEEAARLRQKIGG
jgi:predicted Zn-dependent protease